VALNRRVSSGGNPERRHSRVRQITGNIDVVVMWTHDRTDIQRTLLGSVTEDVVAFGISVLTPHLDPEKQVSHTLPVSHRRGARTGQLSPRPAGSVNRWFVNVGVWIEERSRLSTSDRGISLSTSLLRRRSAALSVNAKLGLPSERCLRDNRQANRPNSKY
jgi:hypothetical protein